MFTLEDTLKGTTNKIGEIKPTLQRGVNQFSDQGSSLRVVNRMW